MYHVCVDQLELKNSKNSFPISVKGCLNTIRDVDNKKEKSTRYLPTVNYDSFRRPAATTRSNPKCVCSWCEIGRKNLGDNVLHNSKMRKKPGPPRLDEAASASVRICQDCKGVFGPGKGLLDRPLLIDIDKLFGEK